MSSGDVPAHFYEQAGVIGCRRRKGAIEVVLITSRRSGRWVIPKGVIDPGESARRAAKREAMEEAGIAGNVDEKPLGRYEYEKWGDTCRVTVFRMRVRDIHDDWPEEAVRDRKWFTPSAAAGKIREPALRKMLAKIE